MSDTKIKSRLGRGLSSLISIPPAAEAPAVEAVVAEPSGGAPGEIPVDQVSPNPHQPRRTINQAAIAELAASFKTNGVIQPIVVRKLANGFELIAGERRLRAAKHAGLTTIPAVVRQVDRFAQAQMALVENIQREDLNPIDRAGGYKTLIEQLGLTQAELAQRLGEDRSTIANHLRLLELAEPVRELIKQGLISLGHAKLIAGISDMAEQDRLAKLVVAKQFSVRDLEKLIQGRAVDKSDKNGVTSVAYLNDLERTLARQLGLRVQVKASAKGGKGRLVIHYGDLDQFDQLMQRLGIKTET